MPTSIITSDDLRDFKLELFDEIKKILIKHNESGLKKYLKSSEVMDLLLKMHYDFRQSKEIKTHGPLFRYKKIFSFLKVLNYNSLFIEFYFKRKSFKLFGVFLRNINISWPTLKCDFFLYLVKSDETIP